jgi:hypothetical protein
MPMKKFNHKTDADGGLESKQLSFDPCSSQGIQVQHVPTDNQYSWSTGGLEQSSSRRVEAKTDRPCR